MPDTVILASTSEIRARMLRAAGLNFTTERPRVDEDAIKNSLCAEGATPHDIADALAEFKCQKVSHKHPEAIVIGCDQVLDFNGTLLSKPEGIEVVQEQLRDLSGQRHKLLSAVVLYKDAKPVWRHVGTARLTMRTLSPEFIADYTERNWDSIRHSVGGYKIEEEGVRLFSAIEGDTFTIQGLPMLPLLSYLVQRGTLSL